MVEEKKEIVKDKEIALVTLSQESGLGIQMPDGTIFDLTGLSLGHAQVLEYLVKSISEIKKNIG